MSEKSDASTTTDDMQMPPLCLFYFSHPFGILSPDPPRVSNAADSCFQQPWMQRIQAQPLPFPRGGNRPCNERNQDNRQAFPQPGKKSCQMHHSPNLKVKKAKCQIHCQRKYSSKTMLPKCEQNFESCNKLVNTDDVKSDECKTIDNSNGEFIAEPSHSKPFNKKNAECRNLTCCGETHLLSKDRNLIRPKKHEAKVLNEHGNKQHQKNILPPIERPTKLCEKDTTYKRWLDVDHQRNNFRLKAFLPPLELQDFESFVPKPSGDEVLIEKEIVYFEDDKEYPSSYIEINVETADEVECSKNGIDLEVKRRERRKRKVRKRRRPVKSSGGVNKARSRPHRSAARKLVNCLLQSVNTDRRAPTATLPALSEVLSTVREAWTSAKSLLPRDNSSMPLTSSPASKQIAMLDSKERCAVKAGASPGLLRRRYSVPETVMRKYKLAQLKSDTDDSDVGSAPSPPRGYSPARRLGNSSNQGSKGFLGSIRPSPLLRRLWGRQGGSHSELRYWDSCSGSSVCESCKRSDKNVSVVKSESGLPPSPVHKLYRNSRSPKKINPFCGQGFSPERYISHLENTRDMLMRETKAQLTSPGKYKNGGSALSERSSFKSTSVSEGSPKLGLSSLATSSYPVTDGNSTSDMTSEVTRSSTSYSSEDVPQTKYKIPLNRPVTAEVSSRNEISQNTSEATKKRRQSVCIYMNSMDSPTVEIKSSTITLESSHPTTQESLKLSESNISNTESYSTPTSKDYETTESLQIIDDLNSTDKVLTTTSSSAFDKSSFTSRTLDSDATPVPQTTSTSDTIVTSETRTSETSHTTETTPTSRTTTLTTTNDDSSRNDSALSTRTSLTTDDGHLTRTPESDVSDNKDDKNKTENDNARQFNNNVIDLSDTGISLNDDTNRNSFNSGTSDAVLSKPGSASKSDSSTALSDTITCHENTGLSKLNFSNLKNTKLECLEVVVSETMNSSLFHDKGKDKIDYGKSTEVAKTKRKEGIKGLCTTSDIDQYVSSILIDSLNSMTDQINEINSNSEEDIKLNILEKEIKVKLQNLCPSPINLPTNTIISSFITNIPDDELLETTIIEEKSRTLAYTTETKMFPIETSIKAPDGGIDDLVKSEYIPNQMTQDSECNNYTEHEPESSPKFETLTFRRSELDNNNFSEVLKETKEKSVEGNSLHFYLNDLNENVEDSETSQDKEVKKAVLEKLNKMFESSQSVDTNFNICIDTPTNNYFCDSVYRDVSHLEMSTDVDVFVDNSLNKMINSIDLCTESQDLSLDNGNQHPETVFQPIKNENINNNFIEKLNMKPLKHSHNVNPENKKIISSIGSGSLYQKPPEKPLVVPRFSAVPNTESMEVNTSSDEEVSSCESDCLSLIDSLDDPNSPRLLEINNIRKASKHDKTPVRGGIITMLPENTTSQKSPIKEKSETFFVPIKDDENECSKETAVVAEHMPEKLKERLIRRQQRRELRKEHRKKKMKLLKKESETHKVGESIKQEDKRELGNVIFLGNSNQEIEGAHIEEKKKSVITNRSGVSKKSVKKDDSLKKDEHKTKEFRSFVIDKRGDIQMTLSKKSPEKESKKDLKCNGLKPKSEKQNIKHHVQESSVYNGKKYDFHEPRYNPNLSGPRRLYQKTEFKEGNKHVEILEIVECIDSSPEPQIYEYDDMYGKDNNSNNKSKIPIPILEKLQKTSKRKPSNKLLKRSMSPISKSSPFHILTAKSDQNHNNKNMNTKVDQIIAKILIDAINEDTLVSNKLRVTPPLYDKKPMHPVVKKLVSSETSSKKYVPPLNIDKNNTVLPKFKQHFDVIPEERSSVSIDSQSEDNSKNRKQSSSIGEISDQTTSSSTKISDTASISEISIDNNVKLYQSINQTNHLLEAATRSINNIAKKTVDVEVQGSVAKKVVECHDVSTSPLPQFVSAATSPIPLDLIEKKSSIGEGKKKQIKGKKALTTKEGWAVFCKSQRVCSPEQEGSRPSSNIPSDREAIEKISEDLQTSDSTNAPHSQRILRRVDSKNNIKQININHKPPRPDKKPSSNHRDVLKEHNKDKISHKVDADKYKLRRNKQDIIISADESSEHITKTTKKPNREHSDEENRNEISKVKYKSKTYDVLDKKESRNSDESKKMLLPSPFANQSYSRSSDSSSGSDSEAVACPTLIPRWLPMSNNFRHRRTINRRSQRKEEIHRPPYQNGTGGWSVTLAGSCYTALPSDVEMKVIFPKTNQQPTSQSDSGLGEESKPRKQQQQLHILDCKKCSSNLESCKCLSAVKRQELVGSEREHFLPPALGRKSSKGSNIGHSSSMEQLSSHSKKYDYLPDVNLTSGNKNRSRRTSVQMDRRFSLHCWLPEDKPQRGQKIAKMQISESIGHPDGEELSVFGCAIMPEVKPRVPTMSERDLTRIHAAQYYSRTRRY